MKQIQKVSLVVLVMFILIFTFSIKFNSLITEFKGVSLSKSDLIQSHIQVSMNTIEGLSTFGRLFFQQENKISSTLYPYLVFSKEKGGYYLDLNTTMPGSANIGNLTGLGALPTEGAAKNELNMALEYNTFFQVYHRHFPEIAWLYYTSENQFIMLYPWTSIDNFFYSSDLKKVAFYRNASPELNPARKSIWTPIYLDAAGKGPMVTLSSPIYDNEQFRGVVSLDLTTDWLSEEIATDFQTFIIDEDDCVLASGKNTLPSDSIQKLQDCLLVTHDDMNRISDFKNHSLHIIGSDFLYITNFEDASWRMISLISIWYIVGKSLLFTLPIILISGLFLLSIFQIEKRRNSEIQLKKKNDLLETTLFSIDEGIIVTDEKGIVTLINKRAQEHTGWTHAEATGNQFHQVFEITNTNSNTRTFDPVTKTLESMENTDFDRDITLISKNRTKTRISGTVSLIVSENNQIAGTVTSFKDITREYEQEKQIEGFLELNFDMLCVVDLSGKYHKVNRKFEEVLGFRSEELAGKSFLTRIHEADLSKTLEAVSRFRDSKQVASLINRFRCKDGTYKYIEWHAQPRIGDFIYSSARDVTEQIIKTEKLENMIGKDPLTGAYNRYYLDSIISGVMEMADYLAEPLSFALIDLDHFKNVNDTWGHPVGDDVLKQIAELIEQNMGDHDLLIRLGGEEFILLMPQTTENEAIIRTDHVRTIISIFRHPISGIQTVSAGVAERQMGETFISWYTRADEALYQAKSLGRNRTHPSPMQE